MAEIELSDVFVEMAGTLVDDFDMLNSLHVLTERCVQLLGVSTAGILLTDGHGAPQNALNSRVLTEQAKA